MGKRLTDAAVKQSLLDQLDHKNARTPYFEDMVNKIMKLRQVAKALEDDIKHRGIVIEEPRMGGTSVQKNNPSIKDYNATIAQIQKLLTQLDLQTNNVMGEGFGSDDLLGA